MKKIFYTIVALTTLFACQQEVGLEEIPGSTIREFTASSENGTKTALSGLDVVWDVHDPVTIFCGTTKWNERAFYRVKDGCEGSVTTTLVSTGESPVYQDMPLNVGVYGEVYNEDLSYSSIGSSYHVSAQLYFPSSRSYCENSFASGDMPMFAVSDINSNSLSFKNLMGALELKFKGDGIVVKSISITGNNNEQISGVVAISSDGSIPGMEFFHGLVPNEESVVLDCGPGVTLDAENATVFYITLPKVTFTSGITVEIQTNKGVIRKTTTKPLSITRNGIQPMSAIALEVPTDPRTIITYGSYNQLHISAEGYGANVISHSFADNKGVVVFDGPVLSIPESEFEETAITSISLPNSVISIGDYAFWDSCLEQIDMPENLRTIGRGAFGISCIESITIPASVQSIGDRAFFEIDTKGHITITMEGATPPSTGNNVWDQDEAGIYAVFVPVGSIQRYRNSWPTIASRIVEKEAFVNLGLSVSWATTNVGANVPEGYGDYFAWGEIAPRNTFYRNDYKYYNSVTLYYTKYVTDRNYGTVDSKRTLDLSDDAARSCLGGSWRMPTKAEAQELYDNCTWTKETINGIKGYRVTSNIAGYTDKSIFFPYAGAYYGNTYQPDFGTYWTSSLSEYDCTDARNINMGDFANIQNYIEYDPRYEGRPIRPVWK